MAWGPVLLMTPHTCKVAGMCPHGLHLQKNQHTNSPSASLVSFGNRDLLSPTLTWQLLLKINSKQKTDRMWQK